MGLIRGAAIDWKHGDSRIKGAAEGNVIESAVTVAVPLAIAFGIVWACQYYP